MGRFLTCRVPINRCFCEGCKAEKTQHQISKGNFNLLYTVSESEKKDSIDAEIFKVQVDIKKIKWIHEDNGDYYAKAQMKVLCPKCDKEHMIDQIIEAPKLFFEKAKKCDSCGGNLSFQEEELEIEDMNGTPFVLVSGKLICEKCNKLSSISVKAEASEIPIDGEHHSLAISCGKGEAIVLEI